MTEAPEPAGGIPEDISELRVLERQARELAEHLSLALEAGGLGTWHFDAVTGQNRWDSRMEQLLGIESGQYRGTFEEWVEAIHPDDRDGALRDFDEALAGTGSFRFEHRVVWSDGSVHWLAHAGHVILDDEGKVAGTIGCTADVSERVLAELERQRLTAAALEAVEHERINRERLEFLAQINDSLAASSTRAEIMGSVTRAVVPHLGDWASIHVLPHPDALYPEVEIAHIDPAMVQYAKDLQEKFPYDPNASTGVAHVIRTAQPEFYPDISDEVVADLELDEDATEILHRLALRSAICVPLIKRGRVLGAMQFVMSSSSRRYTDEDLALAHTVAGRIAASLENRRLTEHQALIAKTLQESLLPKTLPEIPGLDVAVRYWAAGEGTEVGGDFFDVFAIDEDQWAAVIGDVCGTGPAAASLTGLARHTIRSSAWHGDRPHDVLGWLNRAILRTDGDAFCTAAYTTLRRVDDGFEFTADLAGHPLPVLARADGSADTFGRPGTLLGVFDTIKGDTCATLLGPGDTVVLYTDGVTDVPPPHQLTESQFTAIVQRCAVEGASAEQVADNIHAELSQVLPLSKRDDDIALLVLHLG